MSSPSPLGQRSAAPEATTALVFVLAVALLVYALKNTSAEVRAEDRPTSRTGAAELAPAGEHAAVAETGQRVAQEPLPERR